MNPPRKRLPYLLLTAAALVLLAAGIFIGWNQWITVVIVAVPIVIMAAFALLSGRSRIIDEGEFHIESRGSSSEGQMHVDVPVESLPAVIQQAVTGMRRFRIRNISDAGAEIRTSWTMKAWGEDLVLTFEGTGASQTLVKGVAKPVVRSTAVDWGQGASDLRSVFKAIDSQADSVANSES